MKIDSAIGKDGLRRRPVGRRQAELSRHFRCAVLTILVLVLLALDLMFLENIWQQSQLYRAARDAYVDDLHLKKEGIVRHLSLQEVSHYQGEHLFQQWLTRQGLGLASMVGLPRIRLVYAKLGSCLYPVRRKPCIRKLDFEEDVESQVEQIKSWARPDVEEPYCGSQQSAVPLQMNYTEDARLGALLSRACFNCHYPRRGHVLDVPRPDAALETFEHYKEMCLMKIGHKLFEVYIDNATRLIQYDFCVYDEISDVYLRVTVAFERIDLKRWWPIYEIETARFRGLFTKGNYHGVSDDLKVLVLPLLLLAVIGYRCYCDPDHLHPFKLLLLAATLGLLAWRVYCQVEAVVEFERILADAYRAALPETQKMLKTQQARAEHLRLQQHYLSFATLVRHNNYARNAGIGLVLVSVLQLCQYEHYHWRGITLIVVGIRKALRHSFIFLLYFLDLNFVFAVIGHALFGECSAAFGEKTEAFMKLIQFQFMGDMDYGELERCDPVWAPAFFVIVAVLLYVVLVNFTFKYVLGIIGEVRRLKTRQMLQEARDDQLEQTNWSLARCHRGARLSYKDQLRLVCLYDVLTQSLPNSS